MEIPLTGFSSVGVISYDEATNIILVLRWQKQAIPDGEGVLSFPGFRVLSKDGQYLGWVQKSAVNAVKEHLAYMAGEHLREYVVRTHRQGRTEGGTKVVYASYLSAEAHARLPPLPNMKSNYLPPDHPATEQSSMRTPSIQEIVNANVNAASSAAKLEVGRVANDQLSKIIAARLPGQYGELLKTPIGQLALANAFAVASRATCPENKNIQTIVNMMTLDAYQQLFKLLDVPGIVAELMGNKVIAEALAKTETQEKE